MTSTFRLQIEAALVVLNTDRKGLAKHLELSVATLRTWEKRGAPAYARLAVAAVVVGLRPEDPPTKGLDGTEAGVVNDAFTQI